MSEPRILPLYGEDAYLLMLPVAEARPCPACQGLRALFVVRYRAEPGTVVPQLRERCLLCDAATVREEERAWAEAR